MGVIGDTLRETREQRGISIAKAESDTKIKSRYLIALEEEDFGLIPGGDYVTKGFIGSYAGYLGLDSAELISQFNRERLAQPRLVSTTAPPRPIKESSRFGAVVIFLVVTLIVGGSAAYWFRTPLAAVVHSGKGTATPALAPLSSGGTAEASAAVAGERDTRLPVPTATPNPVATREPPPLSPPVSPGVHLTTKATEDCWMRVQADGEQVWDGILEAGQSRNWEAKKVISIDFGNPTGVVTTFNGKLEGRVQELSREWKSPPSEEW